MKACEAIQEELPGYAAQQLTMVERASVDAHVRSCVACQDELRSLLRLEQILDAGLPIVEASPTLRSRFANRMVAELEAEEAEAERRSGLWGWLTRPWLVPAIASAAVALLVLSLSVRETPEPEIARAPRIAAPAVVAAAPKAPAPVAPAKQEAPPVQVAAVEEAAEPVPAELETDPEKFVDFAIIQELDTLQAIDGTQESAG